MAIEYLSSAADFAHLDGALVHPLSSAADFAHLDGALVHPLFLDETHVLVTEDGVALLLPAGMRVQYPGRFGVDAATGGAYVSTDVSGEDALRLAQWGQRLQSADVLDRVRAYVALALAETSAPDKFIHREDI